jgi:hypothetical protein
VNEEAQAHWGLSRQNKRKEALAAVLQKIQVF